MHDSVECLEANGGRLFNFCVPNGGKNFFFFLPLFVFSSYFGERKLYVFKIWYMCLKHFVTVDLVDLFSFGN